MLKLKRFDKAEWFEVPGLEGVRLLIKPITFKTASSLLDKAKTKLNVDGELVDDYNDGEYAFNIFKEALVDFEGVVGEDESLTKDQLKEAMFEYDIFREFVAKKSRELYEKITKDLEEDLKN